MNCDVRDCFQVLGINGGAISITFAEINDILTMISLVLAIGFTIYKIINFNKTDAEKKNAKQ